MSSFLRFFKTHVGAKIAVATLVFGSFLALMAFLILKTSWPSAAPQSALTLFALTATLATVASVILISFLIEVFVLKPLNRLCETMRQVHDGRFDIDLAEAPEDEIGNVARVFASMLSGLREMQQTRKRIEEKLIKTEESLKYRTALAEKARTIERMNSELTDAFNNVALLYTVSQKLSRALTREDLEYKLHEIFHQNYICDQALLYLRGHEENKFLLITAKGLGNEVELRGQPLPLQGGYCNWIIEQKKLLSLNHIEPGLAQIVSPAGLEHLIQGSLLATALDLRGDVQGALLVARQQFNAFSPADSQTFQSLANQIAIAFERCGLYAKTRELAVRDELTGLYNRRQLHNILQHEFKRAERHKRSLSVLMIDIDHFKKINDTFGHAAGDKLLKATAQLLQKNLRETDTIARFGGEEFIIILPDTPLAEAVTVANKLRELIKNRLALPLSGPLVSGIPFPHPIMTLSIGVASFSETTTKIADLLGQADTALYRAKSLGRDQVQTLSSETLPLEEMMKRL